MDEKSMGEAAANYRAWRKAVAERLQIIRGEPVDEEFDDLLAMVIDSWLQRHSEWRDSLGKLKGRGILDVLDAIILRRELHKIGGHGQIGGHNTNSRRFKARRAESSPAIHAR
jgi:hypothetical protein